MPILGVATRFLGLGANGHQVKKAIVVVGLGDKKAKTTNKQATYKWTPLYI